MTWPVGEATHAMRYSISGGGRNAVTNSHLVARATNRSLCGRDGTDWNVVEWGSGEPECRVCRRAAARAAGHQAAGGDR